MDNFQVKFNCVILSYNPDNELTYILSSKKDEINFIQILLTSEILQDYNNYITNHIKSLFLTQIEDFELFPQLIKLHDSTIDRSDNIINCVFGFFMTFTDKIKEDIFWIPFDPSVCKYSETILDVVRHIQ